VTRQALHDPVVTCGHMTRIGIRSLRDNLTATIRRVRAGETFEVTHDGEPVAILAPVRKSRLEDLVATGEATPAAGPFDTSRPLIEPRGGKSVSEILQELRADRL
jgi:antitoxin (DNA-binding transcriptional repressor) of toxin-antitoxin stability system